MAIPRTIEGREYEKFTECETGSGNPAVRTTICQNPGETIKVEFDTAGEVKLIANEVSSIAVGSETTINTYTVPVGKNFDLQLCEVSGDNIAVFKVKINGSPLMTKRTWWNHWNENFQFNNYTASAGDTIIITVINRSAGSFTGNFESNIIGKEYDE